MSQHTTPNSRLDPPAVFAEARRARTDMHVLPPYRRILLLTEGQLGAFTSKTAAALLRYRATDVVGVLDSHAAGTDVRTVFPWSPPVPIVADIAAARTPGRALFVGIAPPGGACPVPCGSTSPCVGRRDGRRQRPAPIPGGRCELAALAQQNEPAFSTCAVPGRADYRNRAALSTSCRRVLTVGTDGNVGKWLPPWN